MKTLLAAECREAKRRLASRGRWLSLVGCAILAVFLVVLPFALAVNVSGLIGETDSFFVNEILPYLLMLPPFVLLSAPLMARLSRRIVRIVRDVREDGVKTGYGRDLLLGLLMIAWSLLPIVVILLAWGIPMTWLDMELFWQFVEAPSLQHIGGLLLPHLVATVATAAAVLLVFPYLLLTKRMFFLPYDAADGCTVREALSRAGRRIRACPKLPMRFLWHFFGLIALSVLSVGVLLVFYTLPLTWTTQALLADEFQIMNEGSPMGSNE